MMADFMLQNYYPMIIAIVMAFVITVILGYPSIPLLRRLKAGQSIREDGPQSHLKKAGTPTMGGLFMVAALVVTTLIVEGFSKDMLVLIIATVGFAGIGFIDDFIKVVFNQLVFHYNNFKREALLAQLDKATAYGAVDSRFKSWIVRFFLGISQKCFNI